MKHLYSPHRRKLSKSRLFISISVNSDCALVIREKIYLETHVNKKVLLRERKRHTARRVAIAISCYSGGGGGPCTEIFFPSLNMYQAKSGVKNFSLYWGGGSLDKKFFSQSEHVSSQIWCQKVSKNFPFTRGGVPRQKIFFWSEHVSSQIWCQKFFPLLRPSTPPPWKSETWDPPPPQNLRHGTPPQNLRHGPPPSKTGSGIPPPRNVNRLKLLPSPILRMAGGN